MKHAAHRACAGTTAVTLLAILAYCCIVAAPPGQAVESQTNVASAGPEPGSAPNRGGLQ